MPNPDFDNVSVTNFEVVSEKAITKVILVGTGVPRTIVASLSSQTTFEMTGKMLMACDRIDHGQLVAVIRQLAARIDPVQAQVPDPGQAREVPGLTSPIAISPPQEASSDPSSVIGHPGVDLLIEHAVMFQQQCREKGLSDALIAKLIDIAMGDGALLSLAEQAISRGVTGLDEAAVGSSPPWFVSTAAGKFTVGVDVAGDVVTLTDPGASSGVEMLSVDAHLLGASLHAASSFVRRARMAHPDSSTSPSTSPTPSTT